MLIDDSDDDLDAEDCMDVDDSDYGDATQASGDISCKNLRSQARHAVVPPPVPSVALFVCICVAISNLARDL